MSTKTTVSGSQIDFRTCPVCGRAVDGGRTYHAHCRNFRNYMNAAFREMSGVLVQSPTLEAAAVIRAQLIGAANLLPVRRHDRRDTRGRFVREEE